jgi:prophage regulatory protein
MSQSSILDSDICECNPYIWDFNVSEVSRRVGFGKTVVYKIIGEGSFPPPYKIMPTAARSSDIEVTARITRIKFGHQGKLKQMC